MIDSKQPNMDDKKVISFGLTVVFLVFVVLGGWMATAPLSSASVAVGKVSAGVEKKTVQHLEGGIIKEIHVKEGDFVKKGDILITLDETQIQAQLSIISSQYQDNLAIKARLEAQKSDNKNIEFSSELVNEESKSSQLNIFETTKKLRNDEKTINSNRIIQLKNQINGLTSLKDSKERRLKSINDEIAELEELFKEKLVDKIRIRDLYREKSSIEGDVANTTSEIAKSNEQISELKNQQLLRDKQFISDTLTQLVEVDSNLSDLKAKIIATKDTLKRINILAPIDGIIVGLNIHSEGAVISPREKILEVVPKNTKLIVTAQVQTTDIDKVVEGLLADVRFSAFNMNQAHVIEGKVLHVSADSFIDEASGQPYYEAEIEVTEDGKNMLKKFNFNLVPGMPAEVMIKNADRTALSYFVKPFTDMLSRGFNEE